MNKRLVVVFVIGILAGVAIGYSLVVFENPGNVWPWESRSWHNLTSFTLATGSPPPSMAGVEIAYPREDIYNYTGPAFTITSGFWRIKVETIPYYNVSKYIAYFTPIPFIIRVIIPPPTSGSFPAFFSSIGLVEPSVYRVTTWTFHEPISYAWPDREYVPIRAIFTFGGAGTYKVLVDTGVGCFKLDIEEYY